jgi:hydroxypyruvate isomerase
MPMRLAVCAEMVFLDLPITERVQRIAEAGFDAEIWDWTRHDVEALAATGAMFSSMTGYIRGDFGAGADELIRTAQESIAVAQTLDCPRLNLHGTGLDGKGLPVVPGEDMPGPLWISAARTLTRLGDMAERAGVTFCLENLNTAVDHPGVPFARAADTLALVEAVGHPRVRLMLDLYHAQIGEGNLIELVRRAGPLIGEIQVADVPGRREPGTGEINYPAVAAARTRWATTAPSAWRPGPPTATATAPWPGSAPPSPSRRRVKRAAASRNAMKPRIQCVLTQWNPGSIASGSRPIVMINVS